MKWIRTLGVVFVAVILLAVLGRWLSTEAKNQRYKDGRAWIETFSPNDDCPFGCKLFDQVMKETCKNGYSFCSDSIEKVVASGQHHNLLLVDDFFNLTSEEVRALAQFVAKGHKLLLVAGATIGGGTRLLDTLGYVLNSERSFYLFDLVNDVKNQKRETIQWCDGAGGLSDMTVSYYSVLNSAVLSHVKEEGAFGRRQWKEEVLAANTPPTGKELMYAVRRDWGKGEVILCSTPLFFTNYGMMDRQIAPYVTRLMSFISNQPITRLSAQFISEEEEEAQGSMFDFMLSNRPLRWALYLALAGIILLMLFAARRRQRVIPVVSTPENHSLAFVKTIGTIYFHHADHADLVRKKFRYCAETLRRKMMIDIYDTKTDKDNFEVIAMKTGYDKDEVARVFLTARKVAAESVELSADQMKTIIQDMNKMMNNI